MSTLPSTVENLVRAHIPLVHRLVVETAVRVPVHISRGDLASAGLAALVTAARSYDAGRGVPFAGFAAARIRGAFLDELRGEDLAGRSLRREARRIGVARQRLAHALGRVPGAAEVAAELGVAVDAVEAVEVNVRRAAVLSLQGLPDGEAISVTEPARGPEELLLHRERLGYLRDAVEALPERLRTVVTRYFLQERPMTEIAAELGVTDSRVSQLRAEALALLREGLEANLDPESRRDRPTGCVARRRAAYAAQIAKSGDLRTRLAATTRWGLPYPFPA